MKKITRRDPEVKELIKLMEIEELRDEARRLEEQNIEHARKLRGLTAARTVGPQAQARGWVDRNR